MFQCACYVLCVHILCVWCEELVLHMRGKDTVQSHSLLQCNVVHEPLQHCVHLWYTPQYITAYTYCTPYSNPHTGTDTQHTYPHHNSVHYVVVSISPFPRRKVAQCNVFEAISLIGKQIDAGVVPRVVHCVRMCVLVGTLVSLCQYTQGIVRSIALLYSKVYRLLCVMRRWKAPV